MSGLSRALAASAVLSLSAAALITTPIAASAAPADPGVVLNEIVYDEISGYTDRVEIYNAGEETVDLTGWKFSDDNRARFGEAPADLELAPGEFFVFVQDEHFTFGLGKGDEVVLYDPSGAIVDEYAYENTAPIAVWARCPDGTGDWAHATTATPGAANDCSTPAVPGSVVLNEVDSQPSDWVELYNPGTEPFDISGYELRDNADDLDHRWAFLEGTIIEAGEYFLVREGDPGLTEGVETGFGVFGIGSADEIRLFDPTGTLVDRTGAWTAHAAIGGDFAAATYARCPDGVGDFVLAYATPGESNLCVAPDVAINEIVSNGDATDWVEIYNFGATPVDISGWTVMDEDPFGHADQTTPLPAGTVLQPGEFYVFDQPRDFVFGLGNGDLVTVRDANGNTVDEHRYPTHNPGVGSWSRCPDGTGEFVAVDVRTKGLFNACGNPVRINEVESDGGSPDDWIELVNPTTDPLDVSGIVVKDEEDDHAYEIPTGTVIAPGGYLVIERDELGFGLGGGDSVRLFEGERLIDSTTWGAGHAAVTWGRCPDTTGPFAVTAEPTKGAPNICPGEIPVSPWPGSAEGRVLDETPTFLEDSSGLDVQETAEGTFLWAVDNGTGTIWKLAASADGAVSLVTGWEDGKRARYQRDAGDPAAAGPDAEGITVDDAGYVYVVAERDNSAKSVNENTILKVDPDAAASDLVAIAEWDITSLLPPVGANLGAEAIEWVSDDALAGKLHDDNTGLPYAPGDYPGHGDGLFFVAVEDGGGVFAFALASGGATLVAEIDPGLPGVMALDYDTVRGVLWAMCDDGCQGRTAEVTLNGTDTPDVAHFARPAGLPDINNEGFATAPASLSVDGQRPVWWFADGYTSQSLRVGTLPGGSGGGDGGSGEEPPLNGEELVEGNRGDIEAPASAVPGERIVIGAGAALAGEEVAVWLYSDPVLIGGGALDALGRITVTIPTDAALGAHRLAVYDADGALIGWTELTVVAVSGGGGGAHPDTGAEPPLGLLALSLLLLAGGGVAMVMRRRVAASADH